MANSLSSKKSLRVSKRQNKVNTITSNEYKKIRKAVKDTLAKNDVKGAKALVSKAYSELDMAAKKKVLHKNTAARYKASVNAMVKKADTAKKD